MQPKFNIHPGSFVKGILIAILLVVCISVVGVLYGVFQLAHTYGVTSTTALQAVKRDTSALVQEQGRTNILLLGIGGEHHESGDLTDTILVVSVSLTTPDIALVSLPRDIWVPSLADKLNTAYHYGEEKEVGSGLAAAKQAAIEVTKVPIHYAVLLDFSGFVQMIDAVGGVDVTISESFTDAAYPIAGRENDECEGLPAQAGDPEFACRFETVIFTQGIEHMDGERALQYVRSRHAEGDSGTDFSRGKRQQAVLVGLKNRLLTPEMFFQKEKLQRFIDATINVVTSNMSASDMLLLGRTMMGEIHIRSVAITQDQPEKSIIGLLINPPTGKYGGRWVLIPKHEDNFVRIGEYLTCELYTQGECGKLVE